MKTVVRKLLVGIAVLVLESLSISKEQLISQRQNLSALRRVHKCERDFYMVSENGTTHDIEAAREQLAAARKAFDSLYNNTLQ